MKVIEKFDGGNSSTVVRIGNQIYRNTGPWTPTIHKLLKQLRGRGVIEDPEVIGIDKKGREILSFIQGNVGNYPLPEWLWSDVILHESFALMRRFHDAANTDDFKDGIWQSQVHEPPQVI